MKKANKRGEILLQEVARFLRERREIETDDAVIKDIDDNLTKLLNAQYDFEERLKNAVTTLGGKYGFLPSGVTDYLPDDFDYEDEDDDE